MKLLIIGLGVLWAGIALAGGKQESKAADEIWRYADSRMQVQGDHWFKDGDFPRVTQLLRMRYEADPENYERMSDLGFMLKSMKMHDEELAIYVEYRVRMVAKDPDAAFPEANFYFERKLFAKVPPVLEPTMNRGPHRNSWTLLARAYEKQGLTKQAIATWKRLLVKLPNDPVALANIERIEAQTGKKPR